MFRDLLDLLVPEIEGTRAWDNAAAIHALDRNFTFSSFHASARWSADRLASAGLTGVEILEAPADGASVFGDWMMPLSWDVGEATFDVISPDGSAERLADRSEIPACLAMWSAPTPADGAEAELLRLENPGDTETWTADQVRGKIVFSSANPHAVKKLLLEAGAVGLLSDFQSPGANLPDAPAQGRLRVVEVTQGSPATGRVVTADLSLFGTTKRVEVTLSADRRLLVARPAPPALGATMTLTMPELEAGDRWSFLSMDPAPVRSVESRALSTPAGQFPDAVRIALGATKEEAVLWFAPGVGLAALDGLGRRLVELTEYRPGGGGN